MNAATRAYVEASLGEAVICSQCGAALATYADKCSARLDERCEGFLAIEAALSAAPASGAVSQ